MKTLRIILLFILFYGLMSSQLQAAEVHGQLISNRNSSPVPGLTVILIHPELGKSAPAISDSNGTFTFYGIPVMQNQYYLEVYWGETLIYRAPVSVNNNRINLSELRI